jgi:hypothetical protein
MSEKMLENFKGTASAVGYVILALVILGLAGFAGYYFAPANTKEAILITIGVIFIIFTLGFVYLYADVKHKR